MLFWGRSVACSLRGVWVTRCRLDDSLTPQSLTGEILGLTVGRALIGVSIDVLAEVDGESFRSWSAFYLCVRALLAGTLSITYMRPDFIEDRSAS